MSSSKWLNITNLFKLLTLLTYFAITAVVETQTAWVIYQILHKYLWNILQSCTIL